MDFVNLDTLIEFIYYDDKLQAYKKVKGTIKEFLQTFSDFSNIPVYSVNYSLLGVIYEKDSKKTN